METHYPNIETQKELVKQAIFREIEMQEARRTAQMLGYSLIVITIVILALCFWPRTAKAEGIPNNLWKGLIAEAVSEDVEGMYAVACVVRNRLDAGMNSGLCGLKRSNLDAFVSRQPTKYHKAAKYIVYCVFTLHTADSTNGALYFESTNFPVSKWAKKMKVVAKIGKHIFYKPVRYTKLTGGK
jgi:hypothetical protein